MVTKSMTILSLLLPIAMLVGTSIAIFFYKYSSLIILILNATGGVMLCAYVLIIKKDHHRLVR